MDENGNIQDAFFQQIKDRLASHLSLVDEVAEVLEVSSDSAYRRIRCETSLTFDEIRILAGHYGISIDGFIKSASDVIGFQYKPIDEKHFTFVNYLEAILEDMYLIDSLEEKEIIYLSNDIPFFNLLQIPEIASFKLFFWRKTVLDFSSLANEKFGLNKEDKKINELSRQIRDLFIKIPCIEIYGAEVVETTLKQIEYYWVSGLFDDNNVAIILCDKLSELFEHIQLQAQFGFKFKYEKGKTLPEGIKEVKEKNYKLYYNEVLHADNTILVKGGETYMTYLTNNAINFLVTSNEGFYKDTLKAVNILIKKSTLLSSTSEKERNRFFLGYQNKIKQLKEKIS